MAIVTKRCGTCRLIKSVSEFYIRRASKDGLTSQCKQCSKEYQVEVRKIKTKEKKSQENKTYYENNTEKVLSANAAYREQHVEEYKDYQKKYKKNYLVNNRETLKEKNKEYNKKNPEVRQRSRLKRKALKRSTRHEYYNRQDVYERDNWICQHPKCFLPVDQALTYPNPWSKSLDHIIPWSKSTREIGGDTFDNVQLMHLRCNLSKRDREL